MTPDNSSSMQYKNPLANFIFVLLIANFALLLVVCSFLRYPEIVRARAAVIDINEKCGLVKMNVDLPAAICDKVFPGQRVDILFDGYPQGRPGQVIELHRSTTIAGENINLVARVHSPIEPGPGDKSAFSYRKEQKADIVITIKNTRLIERFFNSGAIYGKQ